MPDTVRNTLPAVPKSWPFEEAAKLAARLDASGRDAALFETGYGPSGLPHIGTFGEVARTSWVRHAFTVLTGLPSRLLAFSDDMDGLRKVPDTVPNQAMLRAHLGQPLTRIPDPFGTHESFGAHNNARLRSFLDGFGFGYEFASATDCYTAGRFDAALRRVLARHAEIVAVVLPTLGAERAEMRLQQLLVRHVVRHFAQTIHVVAERDEAGRLARQGRVSVADPRSARHLAESADMRQAGGAVSGLEQRIPSPGRGEALGDFRRLLERPGFRRCRRSVSDCVGHSAEAMDGAMLGQSADTHIVHPCPIPPRRAPRVV